MTAGLVILALLPASAPVWALSGIMVLTGLGGPLVMPPVTALLLASQATFMSGLRVSLLIAGGTALAAAAANGLLKETR